MKKSMYLHQSLNMPAEEHLGLEWKIMGRRTIHRRDNGKACDKDLTRQLSRESITEDRGGTCQISEGTIYRDI